VTPRCAEIDEMLAAFALDALDTDERLAVADHLTDCRRHDEALADLRAVTAALAEDIDPVAPPASLRVAVLDAFAAESATAARVEPRPASITSARQARRPVWLRPGFAYGLAAAVLAVAIGLGAWGLSRGGGEDVLTAQAQSGGNLSMRVVFTPDENVAVVTVDLPPLPEGQVYQAWNLEESAVVSLGFLPNQGTVAFEGDLARMKSVAISVEPAGGSPAPTTEPILVSTF
jgi:anti-sigma-K factor RskA